MKRAYLLVYNAASAAAWAFCTLRAASLAVAGAGAGEVYPEIQRTLLAAQTAMLLEVAHSALGLVPSPVATVAVQVGSRIFVVWGHLHFVPECQRHWSLMFIVLSWGVTEVVRYLFYFSALLGAVPYPLFYLRYSLFVVLYPSGIAGELLQVLVGMGAHWRAASPLWYRASAVALLLYVPGSPLMILNMWANRRRSFGKREAARREPQGVVWPATERGDRSSTATNRGILAAAAGAGPGGEEAAARVARERGWRFGYRAHMAEHVRQCLTDADGCLAMARAGLEAAQEAFRFRRRGEPEVSLRAAMAAAGPGASPFETAELAGSAPPPERPELALLYGGPTAGRPYYHFEAQRHARVSGLKLREQVEAWAEYGSIEADTADALKLVQQNQERWLDLRGAHFVLLGAGSAMGPLRFLLSCGATVVAVARPKALRGLLRRARDSPGRLLFPVRRGTDWRALAAAGDWEGLAAAGGCDLLTQTPEIAAWLTSVAPGEQLTVGNYTYLDGALHVQLAVACDCIMERLCRERRDTALAFLGTATDVTPIPREAAAASAAARGRAAPWMRLWEALGVLRPSAVAEGPGGLPYLDSVLTDQGPNYLLAKRLQHWRALAARAAGHTVSSNVAPSTATASVTSNAAFAAAYGGMHVFRPMEVVYEELSMSLMAALLVHDLKNPQSAAQPSQALAHPLCLFQATSAHFGVWRCPYSIGSMGIPSFLLYSLTALWPHMLLLGAALVLGVRYVVYGVPGLPLAELLPPTPAPLLRLAAGLSVPV